MDKKGSYGIANNGQSADRTVARGQAPSQNPQATSKPRPPVFGQGKPADSNSGSK